MRRRTQAGANVWRKVEGVMLDRKILKKLKGKILSTCVTPACLYVLETVALTEQQQQKLHVCENNWVRRITRTKRLYRRRMNDLRKEVGMQCSLTERRRKRGRPQLRWEDCVRRDMRRSREDERWGAADRKPWKERTVGVARQYFT